MRPLHSARVGSSQRLHRITALVFICSCLALRIRADASGVCTNAAETLLASLAVETPERYSTGPCDVAPTTTVCEVSGAAGLCADVSSCNPMTTRIDTSCKPQTEASACCTTFRALPCPGCAIVPLACLQFCLDRETPPAANSTAPAPAPTTLDAPDPSPAPAAPPPAPPPEPPTSNANTTEEPPSIDTAPPPSLASAAVRGPAGGSEADLTPTGMPRQIVVESISRAESSRRLSPLTAAVAALSLLALTCHGGCE